MHSIILLMAAALAAPPEPAKGTLVAVGGGSTAPSITEKTIALIANTPGRVLIVPQASQSSDGQSSAEHWKKAGAKSVSVLNLDASAPAAIAEADLIWMPGGDQNRLAKALQDAKLIEPIRERFRTGAVVGGTSAGAAILSEVMLTGEADLTAVKAGATKTAPGLGLWTTAIVDQHFIKRQRFNRLLSAVFDRPELVGVGIDESTGVVLKGSKFEVIGIGQVMVIDARKPTGSTPWVTTDIKFHVLKAGMTYDLSLPR